MNLMDKNTDKKEQNKKRLNTALALIIGSFITAAVLFWTWPSFIRAFPILVDKGILTGSVTYWQAFGVTWFVITFIGMFREIKSYD